MKAIVLFLLFIFQIFIPLASTSFVKTSKTSLSSASLEDIEYVWTGSALSISDFVVNEDNFKEDGFEFEYRVYTNTLPTWKWYRFDIEVVNGKGDVLNSDKYEDLLTDSFAYAALRPYLKFKFELPKNVMVGKLTFTFNIYYSEKQDFSSNVYIYNSFSFNIHSYYDDVIEFLEEDMKLYYEVEFKNSYLISRYETLTILGAEPILEYPYYGTILLQELDFVYSLASSTLYTGTLYYFVLDDNDHLKHILDYELTLDVTYKGVELLMIEGSGYTFTVVTKDDFYLDTSTYKLSRTRTSVYKTQVNSIYFPKDNYDDFCYTSHIFYLSNFGIKNRNIYFKFYIDMELNYLEDGFYVEGGYGKLIDDYYQEEVIL